MLNSSLVVLDLREPGSAGVLTKPVTDHSPMPTSATAKPKQTKPNLRRACAPTVIPHLAANSHTP